MVKYNTPGLGPGHEMPSRNLTVWLDHSSTSLSCAEFASGSFTRMLNNSSSCPYGRWIRHSKNTRVIFNPERVHWGQTPFRVNDDPEISQPDAEYDPELGQYDPIICHSSLRKADRFPGHPWHGMAFGPNMDPFRVGFDSGVFIEWTSSIVHWTWDFKFLSYIQAC